jgi:hypothetical protein
MFTVTDATFDLELQIERSVGANILTEQNIRNLGNYTTEGFELSSIEQEYYKENNITLNSRLDQICDQKEWIKCSSPLFKINHSLLLQRRSFVGEARERLVDFRKQFLHSYLTSEDVILQVDRLLQMKPKWGLDFALDYNNEKDKLEAMHLEYDFSNYQEALDAKQVLDKKILTTDWIHFVKKLVDNKDKWMYLPGMKKNNWRTCFWGLSGIDRNYKIS